MASTMPMSITQVGGTKTLKNGEAHFAKDIHVADNTTIALRPIYSLKVCANLSVTALANII